MPAGRTHDRITLWALPLVVAVVLRLTLSGRLTATVGLGFLLGGWLLGPDLDIHSVQYKRWGWLRWIWLPYRRQVRHRSRWSHGPLLGTTVRVLYLGLWLAGGSVVVAALLNETGQSALTWGSLGQGVWTGLQRHWSTWAALALGLELGALSHYGADWLVSGLKAGRRGKRR